MDGESHASTLYSLRHRPPAYKHEVGNLATPNNQQATPAGQIVVAMSRSATTGGQWRAKLQ